MTIRGAVWRSFYQDSMALMRLAAELRECPGVRQAAALMGTPANHRLIADAGLARPELEGAAAGDLMLAVEASDEQAAEEALAAARRFFEERRRERETAGRASPRTLASALRELPGANLAVVSVPGPHVKLEALGALRHGLHVFVFSDNVPLEDEIELKGFAASRRLLCMGPDCGTAYLGGVGLGFANVVPRGRIGCVAAAGTGLQAVASHLAALGEGISHAIGVGGRDLSEPVGGRMTRLALELLASDPATRVIVLISKPPAPSVMAELDVVISAIAKPVVVCCLGASPAAGHAVATLEDAAGAAVALARGSPWRPRAFSDPVAARARLSSLPGASPRGDHLLGLYTGGTLAHEARLLLEPHLGPIATESVGAERAGHRILDLGADQFTQGRPHPMLDPSERAARVREAGQRADVGVLLVDLVLGRAVHPDPARALAAAVSGARADAAAAGRSLVVVGSVVGTTGDPQDLDAQRAVLESAGILVFPSNAQASRFAASLVEPEASKILLGADS